MEENAVESTQDVYIMLLSQKYKEVHMPEKHCSSLMLSSLGSFIGKMCVSVLCVCVCRMYSNYKKKTDLTFAGSRLLLPFPSFLFLLCYQSSTVEYGELCILHCKNPLSLAFLVFLFQTCVQRACYNIPRGRNTF